MAKSNIRDVFSFAEFDISQLIGAVSTYDLIVPLPNGPWTWGQALIKNTGPSASGTDNRGGFFMFTTDENDSWGQATTITSSLFQCSGGVPYTFYISRPRVYFFDVDARTSHYIWGNISNSPRIQLDSAVIQNSGNEVRFRFRNVYGLTLRLDARGRIKVMKTQEVT